MKPVALALLAVVSAGSLHAQQPALIEQELQRLGQAQHLRFRAMLILSMSNQLSTVRLAPQQARTDGALARELTIDAAGLHLAQTDGQQLVLEHRSWQPPSVDVQDLARIQQGYRIQALALDRVDGRDALPLRFDPVDRWRYGTTLWIDRGTGLVVKTEMRSIDGQTLAQAMLAEVEVLDAAVPAAPAPATTPASRPLRWRLQGLPEGFTIITGAPGQDGDQLLVGDGVASVSVFVEPLAAGQPAQRGNQQRGLLATQADVRGDYQLIAVGAVPPHTIERILNGLTPAN